MNDPGQDVERLREWLREALDRWEDAAETVHADRCVFCRGECTSDIDRIRTEAGIPREEP